MTQSIPRRDFLRRSIGGAAAGLALPAYLQQALFNTTAQAAGEGGGGGGPLLVIMELKGGNDSLNTAIPFADDIYYQERPTLAIPENLVLKLDGTMGLHPALANIRALWEEGCVAQVHGVGYETPNLSHFTSFDYWHTAAPNQPIHNGWLGRFYEHECEGCSPTSAIDFADEPTLAMRGSNGVTAGIAVDSPDEFTFRHSASERRAEAMAARYNQVVGLDHPNDDGVSEDDDVLAYVQRSAQTAMLSSRQVLDALASSAASGTFPSPDVTFPNNSLGRDFGDVAGLIHGGLDTNLFYLHQGGYDTHNNQGDVADPLLGRHNQLLTTLDQSIGAFVAEMKAQGHWERTLIVTVSEFGRKVHENGSNGTDHGAAATLFAIGGAVQGGHYGAMPALDEGSRIKNGSMAYTTDFRSVYRTVLQSWLQVPEDRVGNIIPTSVDLIPFL